MFARHHIAKLVGTAMAAAALGLSTAGSAAADPTDDAFLRRLAADGVMFAGSAAVIQKAQVVCGAFSAGMSPAGVHTTMMGDTAMTPAQMALFMAEAVQAYCPSFAGQLFS